MKAEIVARPDKVFEDPRTIAVLPWRAPNLESYLGSDMISYVEDGLGEAKAVFLRLPSGRVILARELCEAPNPRVFLDAGSDHSSALDDTLELFPVSLDDYLWTLKDGYSDEPCELNRLDDNGAECLVGEFESLIEARLRKHELEAGGRKQHYWIKRRSEKVGDGKLDPASSD